LLVAYKDQVTGRVCIWYVGAFSFGYCPCSLQFIFVIMDFTVRFNMCLFVPQLRK
jgi:hypothetical protein